MGYSEIYCSICGVSFNINRYRTDKEPPSAALGEPQFLNAEDCTDENGCYFVQRSESSIPLADQVKYPPSEIENSDIPEDEWEHIPGLNCSEHGAYNGHRISIAAMKGCNTFQCLVRKPKDWKPQPDDEEFEVKGECFLSGLGDDMPSRDVDWPTVFPGRHGISQPRADNIIWDENEMGEYAMPFHPTCLEIFKRASLKHSGVVDIQGLTQWWRLENDYDDFHAFPRHEAVKKAQEQWWSHVLGDEFLAANPCFIPGFESLLQSSPVTDSQDSTPMLKAISNEGSNNDPFSKLPPEIRHSILVQLNFKDLANLRLTSRVFLQLPNPVLYELTIRRTPWLYEAWSTLPISFWATTTQEAVEKEAEDNSDFLKHSHPATLVCQLSRTETDWLHVQTEISRNWPKLLGLRNRRRIWKDCEEILKRVDKHRAQGNIKALNS
ncbi:hypothetical protein FLONG3_4961 [Fusarium longipes]|uniref:F-box domain-containing protein n=1 Tax=Fusarium longipes TaxID=694270 RepID=A0A395SWM5_9HYPO|nr:hypothetical protein FLONG3_4961 [Fusarium longipes]